MSLNIGLITMGGSDQRAVHATRAIQKLIHARVTNVNLHTMVPKYWVRRANTKAVYQKTVEGAAAFDKIFQKICQGGAIFKYDAFICYDVAFAHYVLPEKDAKSLQNVDQLAGMIVEVFGKPVLFIADPLHMYTRGASDEDRAVAAFVNNFHLKKLANRISGLASVEKPIKFILPKSIGDLKVAAEIAENSELIAFDIENSGGFISCIGFACETKTSHTPVIVIPLMINLPDTDGRYWADDAAAHFAFATIERILTNKVPKCAHNGSYDITHLFRYGWYVNNYIYDTMVMLHATWPTVSRALYVGASMFLDRYAYWKDDGKDVSEDGKVKWQVPTTPAATYNYWRYNGLDCANTLELCLAILAAWTGEDGGRFPKPHSGYAYVWQTYIRQFTVEFGPCLYMSMHGLEVDPQRQRALKQKLQAEAAEKAEELRELVGDPDYNPKSPGQNSWLLYDVLQIKPLARKGRTTDKKILQSFADEHPIYKTVIDAITAAKEPANNASKYGDLPMKNGWWLYQLKAAATTTSRLASSKHNSGYGTNMQNVPASMREMARVSKGNVLVSTDYSQSDSYFVAFECGDKTMIDTVTDDRDTHSVHVEFFFGYPYASVVEGAEKKEAWVVHPDTGVRQIIKKVSHGTNYDMGGATMLLNIRRPAAIAMVRALLSGNNANLFMKALGLDSGRGAEYYANNAQLFSTKQLEAACEFAQALYYRRYPAAKQWKSAVVLDAQRDFGVIEMFGGSSTVMIGRPMENPRFVPAAKGQGGTAGNINNAMLRLYLLAESMWKDGYRMIIQVHDEIVSSVPETRLDLIDRQIAIMEEPCVIRGRKFVVPVEAELSRTWTKKATVVWQGLQNKTVQDYLTAVDEKEAAIVAKLTPKEIF